MLEILTLHQPYLLSMGVSKQVTSLAWAAGPLCGTIVQPLVGVLSDHMDVSRKELVMLGAVASSVSLLGLALADPFSAIFATFIDTDPGLSTRQATLFEALVFFWIWALSLSVQPLQAASRALVVESCPDHQQSQAAAWIGRAAAGGNVVGYALGILPFTEFQLTSHWRPFQLLCVITGVFQIPLSFITCYFSSETRFTAKFHTTRSKTSLLSMVKRITHEFKSSSYLARGVFYIQFLSWLSWFPIMYYQTQ